MPLSKKLIYFFSLVFFTYYSSSLIAQNSEVITNGDFESGMVDFEIFQYPVYPIGEKISIVHNDAISGNYSLKLPFRIKGGYKFVFPILLLNKYDSVDIDFKVQSEKTVVVHLDGFIQRKKVVNFSERVKKNQKEFSFTITEGIVKKSKSPISFIIRIKAEDDVFIDDVSIKTTGVYPGISSFNLIPNLALGTYGIDESGSVLLNQSGDKEYKYRILNYLDNTLVANGNVHAGDKIKLYTKKRGSYRIAISALNSKDNEVIYWRLYAVINKTSHTLKKDGRYGVAMEEYGQRQMINSRVSGNEYYQLANQIGVSDVRLFTAAMPYFLSETGNTYDFTSSDEMLALSEKYLLEPLIELGSNTPERLPDWLRSSNLLTAGFNIADGLKSKKLRFKFLKKMSAPYFDSTEYEKYLKVVFLHFSDRVKYYEIWNEPGHKFKSDDFLKIAKLTRKVQKKYASTSKLIGYTSTKGAGVGKGIDINLLPEFTEKMVETCANCIDILSYHSEHAFIFFGRSVDHNNEENGYVSRLRKIMETNHQVEIPIWDTERGVKWYSPHTERIDYVNGARLSDTGRKIVSVDEVARRLPGIHAAAFANGVEKIFWFYMNSGSMTSARSHGRFGFFDSNLEPMPHLPVYDAMTELLGEMKFVNLSEKTDGTRAYRFHNSQTGRSIILVYNWKQKETQFIVPIECSQVKVLNIFGNEMAIPEQLNHEFTLNIDGWPIYILLENSSK
ncbi:MAG: hypothetical protein QM500_20160 [Methylococcales bacterium]